jgi:hypothetical protein
MRSQEGFAELEALRHAAESGECLLHDRCHQALPPPGAPAVPSGRVIPV